jgi:ABC-type amino acid transport substrate-binding protein
MKTLAALAHVVLALCLVGCGKSSKDKFVIAMDATYPPFEIKNEKDEFSGVSVDLGKALAAHLGKEVEFRNMNFDGLIAALKSGSVDCIISSMTANDERRESIDFSDPYVKTGLALLAAKESPVQSLEDLQAPGRKVVVRLGTTGESFAKKNLPDAKLIQLDTDTACVMEVVKGSVDAWVYDQLSLMNYQERYPDNTRALLKPVQEEFWAVGLRQGDTELKAKINEFLAKYRAEGGFATLATKYLAKESELMKAQGIPFVFEVGK